MPEIHFPCPRCGGGETRTTAPSEAPCTLCGAPVRIAPTAGWSEGLPVAACFLCGQADLYVQKDLNRRLGVFVILAGVGIAFWAYERGPALGMAVLLGLTVADVVAYAALPTITICYACGAIHRGFPRNPAHGPFDLHIGEKYMRPGGG